MTPQRFPESNFTFLKPKGVENCVDLPVFKGQGVIVSSWRPTPQDLVRLNLGEPLWLFITGEGMPPVALTTESPFG